MAGTGTKRIIELTEASTIQSGDFIAVDSNARGTKKVPTDTLATSAALTTETNARAGADEQMSERMDGIEEQTALIQNPTKTLSGALCSFTDGANMPMVACTAEIVPKQSGTGTPSPDNVRPISGWESVDLWSGTANALDLSWWSGRTYNGITFTLQPNGKVRMYGTTMGASWTFIDHEVSLPYNGIGAGDEILLYSDSQIFIRFYDSNNTPIGDVVANNASKVSTIPATATKMRVYIYAFGEVPTAETTYDVEHSFYLSRNTTFTEWQPYTGTTTTTPLGRTVYGADAEIVGGSLTDKMGMATFDGSEAWALDATVSGVTKFYITQSDMKKMNNYTSALIANNMTASRNGYTTDDVSYMSVTGYSGSVGNYIYIMSKGAETGITTVAQLKEWLASHNLQVVYPLEQPQTYQLTPTQINTLLGENNVWADAGDVEVTYRRDINLALEQLEALLNS